MKLRTRVLTAGVAALVAGVAAVVLFGPSRPPIPLAVAEEPKAAAAKGDHVMFGGTPDRNFVNLIDTGLSHEFPKAEGGDTHVLGNRIKWQETLGSRAYGGPIIAGGKIFVGTNNENP